MRSSRLTSFCSSSLLCSTDTDPEAHRPIPRCSQPSEPTTLFLVLVEQCFDRVHDGRLPIANTIIPQLLRIGDEILCIEDSPGRQERQRFDRSHTRHRGLETRERTFAQAEAACARVLGAVCGSDRLVLWHCEGAGWSGDPTIRRA